MKNYEIFSGEELKIADLILRRRLQLLVHSKIYYEMDSNIISDKQWDELAKELVKLQADYPEISKQVDWYDAFADWDGSTGAFLPLDDPWVVKTAKKLKSPNLKNNIVSQNGVKKKSLFDTPVPNKKQTVVKPTKSVKKSLF